LNRMVSSDILVKLVSMAVAGAIGFYIGKKYTENEFQDEIDRRVAIEITDWLQQQARDISEANDRAAKAIDTEKPVDTGSVMTPDISIQSGEWNIGQYKNYVQCYDPEDEETAHPTEDEDYINDVEGMILTQDYQNARGPREMEWEEIGQPGLGEEIVLLWHVDEHWMETEDGQVIDDPYQLVGDVLATSGFNDDRNRRVINIINEQRGEQYEVMKIVGRSID